MDNYKDMYNEIRLHLGKDKQLMLDSLYKEFERRFEHIQEIKENCIDFSIKDDKQDIMWV